MINLFDRLAEKLQPKPEVVHNGVDGKKAMVKVGGVVFEGKLSGQDFEPDAIFLNDKPTGGISLSSQPIIKIP